MLSWHWNGSARVVNGYKRPIQLISQYWDENCLFGPPNYFYIHQQHDQCEGYSVKVDFLLNIHQCYPCGPFGSDSVTIWGHSITNESPSIQSVLESSKGHSIGNGLSLLNPTWRDEVLCQEINLNIETNCYSSIDFPVNITATRRTTGP